MLEQPTPQELHCDLKSRQHSEDEKQNTERPQKGGIPTTFRVSTCQRLRIPSFHGKRLLYGPARSKRGDEAQRPVQKRKDYFFQHARQGV